MADGLMMSGRPTRPAAEPRWIARGEDLLQPGHLACPGCAAPLLMRTFLQLAGPRTVLCIPACCYAVIDGPFPYSSSGVNVVHCAFETAAVTAAGVKAGLRARGIDDVLVVAWAGDGGTFDIGLQSMSACAERNEDILYVCYDNEAYMNTGIQRSGATPALAWTSNTASGKKGRKKDLDGIMAAHRIPYFATVSPGFHEDLVAKMSRAIRTPGFRMLHALSPCPPGWKLEERHTLTAARLAVETGLFPLYEVENGAVWRETVRPPRRPVAEYLGLQGRFGQVVPEKVQDIQRMVDDDAALLAQRFRASAEPR
jgi:pyruvate ferredoxin oxidoreductase beta subunit/2-oxoisovalerate ferredoxin oxidoreductase beta subunit